MPASVMETHCFAGSKSLRIIVWGPGRCLETKRCPNLSRLLWIYGLTTLERIQCDGLPSKRYGARNASCCWTFLHLGKCPYFYSSTFLLPPASWTLLVSYHAELRLFFVSLSDWVGLQRPSEVHLPLLLVSLARFDFSLSLTVPVYYLWYSSSLSELSFGTS